MFKKSHIVALIMLFLSISLPANDKTKAASPSLIITPENANQIVLLATLWHPGEYTLGYISELQYRFSPDSSLLMTFSDSYDKASSQVIRLWNTSTLTLQDELHFDMNYGIFDLSLSYDNRELTVYSGHNEEMKPPSSEKDTVTVSMVHRDKYSIFTDTYTSPAIMKVKAGVKETPCYNSGSQSSDTFSPDYGTMISCDNSKLVFIDTKTDTIRAEASAASEYAPWRLAYSPDSKLLATLVSYESMDLLQCQLQLWDVQTGAELLNSPFRCDAITFSPDGSLITSQMAYDGSVLVLGIPDSNRSAYMSVPARIVPSTIAVRAKPSFNAETTGYVSGSIVVSGVDPTGKFYYMESYGGGWINASASFVDLGVFSTKAQLHIRNP